jgi:hypothetical protein
MKDIAGRPLAVGNWVAVARRNSRWTDKDDPMLTIGKILTDPDEKTGIIEVEIQNPAVSMSVVQPFYPHDAVYISEQDALVARLCNRK